MPLDQDAPAPHESGPPPAGSPAPASPPPPSAALPAAQQAQASAEGPRRAPRGPGRNRRWIFAVTLALIAVAAIVVFRYFSYASAHPTTDDATVQGDAVAVSSKILGRVRQVLVEGDQFVHRGQLVVTLDPVDAQVQMQQAEAARAQAVAAAAQAGTARASEVAARATLERAQRDYARMQMLFAQGAVAAQELDAARAASQVAAAQYRSARDQLAAAVDQQRAAAAQAQAQRVAAQAELHETQIVAPVDGYVAHQVPAQPSQVAQPGQTLMMLIPARPRWVDANFKETQLRNVRVGQPATIHVDLLNRTLHGHVERIGPTTSAALALLPPQNASGNYTKVVQRVPVRIALDDGVDESLGVGLSVEVAVDTTRRPAQAGQATTR